MADFKGGFAFNNGAAKVEVEQEADGTLVSCINPVTGEELGGGGLSVEAFSGTLKIKNSTGYAAVISVPMISSDDKLVIYETSVSNNQTWTTQAAWAGKVALINGTIIVGLQSVTGVAATGATVEKVNNTTPMFSGWIVTPDDVESTVQLTITM